MENRYELYQKVADASQTSFDEFCELLHDDMCADIKKAIRVIERNISLSTIFFLIVVPTTFSITLSI
jgi:hypothetical protein